MLRQATKTIARQIVRRILNRKAQQFHFVQDYERWVAYLVATRPIDEAMAAAVGGNYELTGGVERDLLIWSGLQDGMSIVDLGCGAGRLAHALGQSVKVEYLGIDIIQTLLDYAKSKSPSNYVFKLHRGLNIPAQDNFADFVTAFSVFTHLLHSESYLYLEDIRRVLKPGGTCVVSFLEFADPDHWQTFASEVESRRPGSTALRTQLNTLVERPTIERWIDHLGYTLDGFVDGRDAPWGTGSLGQTVAILRKPSGGA